MADIIIGIGEAAASKNSDDILKTFALGSCVAVILLDPQTKVVGMVHIALPESKIDPKKSEKLPGYFADTGIPHLLNLMRKHDSTPNSKYIVKLAGGANIMDENNYFQIGRRNLTEIKKILWNAELFVSAEDVGGFESRTVKVHVGNGRVFLSAADGREWRI